MGEYDGPKSQFNSAVAILIRIDILWKQAHQHCRDGNFEKWNMDLDRVYMELCPDFSDEDNKKFKELNDEILKIGFYRCKKTERLLNSSKLYQAIFKKEVYLRKMQNEHGKGMSYEEDLDDYMD